MRGMPFAGELTEIVTDSRKVTPGCLFAAIRGEHADGHDYIASAFEKGAACCLAERVPEETGAGGCLLLVPDTVAALQQIAGAYRKEFHKIPLIGVTGSVGKTTMKEMVFAALSRRFRVHKTEGNFNNDLGVPLTLFGLREEHEAAVVELGVSHPGDMARIASIAAPTMAVYTNIGDAHLEYLGSREGVLKEKSSMNMYLPEEAAVFCNGDDPLLATMPCRDGLRKVLYGLGEDCAVRASGIETLPDGTTACDITAGAQCFRVVIPAFGEHMVYAALGAAAVGLTLGLTAEEIAAGISDYAPVGRRARFYRAGALTLIDDCYNANPTSMTAALRSLSRLEVKGRKVAVLGDMLELGEASEALHRETGTLARECGIGLVLTTGTQARCIAEGAGREIARHFEEKTDLIRALPTLLAPGDAVLVKASRGAQFEEITAALDTLLPAP